MLQPYPQNPVLKAVIAPRQLAVCLLTAGMLLPVHQAAAKDDAEDQKNNIPLQSLLHKAKKENLAAAQSQLGSVYYAGALGVEQDYEQAFHWFERAAEQGFARAQFNLGLCYERGEEELSGMGQTRDREKALEWYAKAAKQGLLQAEVNAGILHAEMGEFEQANAYFRSGSRRGNIFCIREYGRSLLRGRGIAADPVAAVGLLTRCAESGDVEGHMLLADAYSGIYDEIPSDPKRMIEHLWTAAGEGLPEAQSKMGFCFEEGIGVQRDTEQAVKWYRKAADNGFARAMINLGHCYANGRGVPQNLELAYRFYRQAADLKLDVGLYNTGVCHALGEGVKQSDSLAAACFQQASDLGHGLAQYNLGLFYEHGRGVGQNDALAYFWYKNAADQGLGRALTAVGYCQLKGIGTEADEAAARKSFEAAAERGDAEAAEALKRW
jgi:TPR repeat protein